MRTTNHTKHTKGGLLHAPHPESFSRRTFEQKVTKETKGLLIQGSSFPSLPSVQIRFPIFRVIRVFDGS